MKEKDIRVNLTAEFMNNIKMIKIYNLNETFKELIDK